MGRYISGERPTRRVRVVAAAATPAAGADWSLTVPAGHLYELLSVYASLVTDANVATRSVSLVLTDGQATYLVLAAPGTQAASLTWGYAWTQHGNAYAGADGIVSGIPRLLLEPGWTIAASTASKQAGDQWGTPRLLVLDTLIERGRVEVGQLPELLVEVVNPGGH